MTSVTMAAFCCAKAVKPVPHKSRPFRSVWGVMLFRLVIENELSIPNFPNCVERRVELIANFRLRFVLKQAQQALGFLRRDFTGFEPVNEVCAVSSRVAQVLRFAELFPKNYSFITSG